MKKLIIVFLTFFSLLFPQFNIPPEVKEILDKTENIFKGKKIEAKIDFSTEFQGMKIEFESKIMADLNSGKFYVENGDKSIVVCDGNYLWNYDKTTNFYSKIPLKKNGRLPSQYVFPLFIIDLAKAIPKIENIDIGKVNFEDKNCYLITFSGKDFENNSHIINLWINSENYYPVQIRLLTQNKNFQMNYKIKSL
ncbi:MAG: hypothetical protein NZ891_03800, partial [bacterium]|nr:hypothetical protein [bacterium]MDW8163849.1 hypothetical protein [Candidatus Omnitrophota bacterium]